MCKIPASVRMTGVILLLAASLCSLPGHAPLAADASGGPIGALGTLRPRGGVAVLAGPGGSTIAELPAKLNDAVHRGQVLARFSNWNSADAELTSIKLQEDELVANNRNDVRLKELDIAQAHADLDRSQHSLSNYMAMGKDAQVVSIRDDRQNQVKDAQYRLKVRQIEMESLQTRFKAEQAKLENRRHIAELTLANAQLTAPFDGVVLDIRKRPGESSAGPILSLGDVSAMQVEAEVFEGDLARVHVGQTAFVSSKSLPNREKATVVSIGRLINVDRKVAKILLTLDKSDPASHYVGMEVNVSVQP